MSINTSELESKIGIQFKDKDLLLTALTHRSYLNENPSWKLDHNERLEFLGDAVLEMAVTDELYAKYPNPEGELTNWRAALVNAVMLAQLSAEINLNDYILMSRGEAKDTGRARQYILANAMEALIGAIYLDQGYTIAKQFITRWVLTRLPYVLENGLWIDAKSRFQESAQELLGVTPTYRVLEESGPDHDKIFKVGAYLDKELVASGTGSSKQEAQTDAAEAAIKVKGWKGPKIDIIKRKPGDSL